MNHIDQTMAAAEKICQQSGSRLTQRRKQVLHCLLETPKALSAYELIDCCKKSHQATIAPMTIYRALDFLESKHLVHKLNATNKYVACAYISQHHHHQVSQFLICKHCGAVTETSTDKDTVKALKHNAQQAGYQLQNPQIELHCLCPSCRSGASPEHTL